MKQLLRIAALIVLTTSPALAEVTVLPTLVREGFFQAPDCTPTADPKQFNECLCKADIHKADVTGIAPDIAASINQVLAQVPQQLAGESCEGKPAAAPLPNILFNEANASFNVALQTPTTLTVLVVYSTYGAGAAHPLAGTEGFTFDLRTGKQVDPIQYLNAEQLTKANNYAQQALVKKYGEQLFDEAKLRRDPYLTEGGCDTCTLYYAKDGWTLRFQLYAIAPYSVGEPEITIPADIIPAPETLVMKK